MLSACCKCFIQSNIHIREYLGYYADLRNQLLVERDFHVPKMNNQRCETLTFGSLLCSLHFMCKSISQVLKTLRKGENCDYFSNCFIFR